MYEHASGRVPQRQHLLIELMPIVLRRNDLQRAARSAHNAVRTQCRHKRRRAVQGLIRNRSHELLVLEAVADPGPRRKREHGWLVISGDLKALHWPSTQESSARIRKRSSHSIDRHAHQDSVFHSNLQEQLVGQGLLERLFAGHFCEAHRFGQPGQRFCSDLLQAGFGVQREQLHTVV